MGKRKIDKDGAHMHGCECKECTKTNVTCPECGRHYWTEPDDPQFECPHCMLKWHEGHPDKFRDYCHKRYNLYI